jgi:predicted ABC-type exoprotein transport system permease subunit
MGRASRRKHDRVTQPITRPSVLSYMPDGPTLLFVVGIVLLAYGTAAMQYSRWNHAANRLVHPVFHPLAIVLGVVVTWLAIKRTRRT